MTRAGHGATRRAAWVPWLHWTLLLVGVAIALLWWSPRPTAARSDGASTGADDDQLAQGRALFETACVSCHGDQGQGTDRGPTLRGEGAAAAHFVLSTGRMPLAEPHKEARRKPPVFNPDEIAALTAYVGTFGGPEVPIVDMARADVSRGGELFRLNCAGCHSAAGSGGALGGGWAAPDLRRATDVQIAEAMLVGPGRMPSFAQFDDGQVASIVSYVNTLQPPASRGGAGLGYVGPVAEGFVAWVVGIGLLVFVIRRIGDTS